MVIPYVPKAVAELALETGDIVEVTEKVDGPWWKGRVNGREGWFPMNFVEEIPEAGSGINMYNVPNLS